MISITQTDKKITLDSPYHPDMPARARAIGGRWDRAKRHWCFDIRDADRVRELAFDIYGTDGSARVEMVDVRVPLAWHARHHRGTEIYGFGRLLAKRTYRDSPPRLGDSVILVEGAFLRRGGSVKNPSVEPDEDSVLLVRDVPRALAERTIAEGSREWSGAEIVTKISTRTLPPIELDQGQVAELEAYARRHDLSLDETIKEAIDRFVRSEHQ